MHHSILIKIIFIGTFLLLENCATSKPLSLDHITKPLPIGNYAPPPCEANKEKNISFNYQNDWSFLFIQFAESIAHPVDIERKIIAADIDDESPVYIDTIKGASKNSVLTAP